MAQPGFWDTVLPNFFKFEEGSHGTAVPKVRIDSSVSFVQLPQTFAGLTLEEDFFDMRNEYGFRMSNTVRAAVGAVTSCGTTRHVAFPS